MQQFGDESDDGPQDFIEKAGRSTSGSTERGQAFTTHQRADLRWIYRLDGKESERTYPTAGDAERGALAALMAQAKKKAQTWKLAFVAAIASTPILYVLYYIYRVMTGH